MGILTNWRKRGAARRRFVSGGKSALSANARGKARRLGVESLEARQLMAADLPEAFARFDSHEELKQVLLDASLKQYETLFGTQTQLWFRHWGDALTPQASFQTSFDIARASTAEISNSHSTTNVQVAGIDEADIVETDGQHIFTVHGGRLFITSALPANQMSLEADVALPGSAVGMFLSGNRLTVITQQWHWWGADPLFGRMPVDSLPYSPSKTLRNSVSVTVFDVADVTAPVIVEQTKLDGSYISARAIGDKVFVLVSNDNLQLPPPILKYDAPGTDTNPDAPNPDAPNPDAPNPIGETVDARVMINLDSGMVGRPYYYDPSWESPNARYETRSEYLARVTPQLDAIIAGILPEYSAWNGEGEFVRGGVLHEPQDILKPLSDMTSQLTSIVAFDVFDDQSGPVAAEAVPTSWSATQYASHDHLYFFETTWNSTWTESTTNILVFDWNVSSGEIRASARGEVPGTLINQFAADEFDGRLRLATTERLFNTSFAEPQTRNEVFVLETVGSQLQVVGDVELVAPGESIRSVRFDDDKAYVVTFLQIDPLFTVDLSDPTSPQVLGELKIPGFSGYLQVLDDTHVLGIGRVQGDGWSWQVQVSLFDVSDLTNPERIAVYTFAENIWGSSAESNHLAVTWMPELGILGIPISGWNIRNSDSSSDNGETNLESSLISIPYIDYFGGLALLDVDLDPDADPASDIQLIGIVPQDGNLRSLRIGETIYAISNDDILAINPSNPAEPLGKLELPRYSPYPYDGILEFQPILWIGMPAFVDGGDMIADATADEAMIAKLNDVGSTSSAHGGPQDPSLSPSPWDDNELSYLVPEALDQLAELLGVAPGSIRLVTAERVGESADENDGDTARTQFNLVFGVGDEHYLMRASDSKGIVSLELAEGEFQFSSEALQREWHNATEPLDTDGDGLVAPLDALIVINELNSKGPMPLRGERPLRSISLENRPQFAIPSPIPYRFDSSGDDLLSPIDALLIINHLNGPVDGESEATGNALLEQSGTESGRWAAMAGGEDLASPVISTGDASMEEESLATWKSARDGQFAFHDAALQVWLDEREDDGIWEPLAGVRQSGLDGEQATLDD